MLKRRILKRLDYQKKIGLYRNPVKVERRNGKYIYVNGKKLCNFASNDYIGLSSSKKLQEKIALNFSKYSYSSSSSRLVSGNYDAINEAEKAFAEYFGFESCLFFSSGYQANIGILSTLFEKDDTIIFDKHIHASSIKGIILSNTPFLGYKHNSMTHLENRLKKSISLNKPLQNNHKLIAVITESLFSMDGDYLKINDISYLKDKYDFFSIIDEAHAFGAVGEKGKGIAHNISDIAVGTLGKAMGLFGAFCLCPGWIKDYLINFSSPFIYTTTLPEAHAISAIDILKKVHDSDNSREKLAYNSEFMKKNLIEKGFRVNGDAHILSLEIGDETRCLKLSKQLFEKGFLAFPARFPTVPLGRAIIRISMNSLHDENDVKAFTQTLKQCL